MQARPALRKASPTARSQVAGSFWAAMGTAMQSSATSKSNFRIFSLSCEKTYSWRLSNEMGRIATDGILQSGEGYGGHDERLGLRQFAKLTVTQK
jgi:hypothetical protein